MFRVASGRSGGALLLAACGRGGGGMAPPGPPTQVVKNAGDAQSWYFNNPLPTQLSVKALDATNRAVPGVVVNWAVASGGGGVNPAQSTTDPSSVAGTSDSIGSAAAQSVTATPAIMTLPTVTVTASAAAAPTAGSVTPIPSSRCAAAALPRSGARGHPGRTRRHSGGGRPAASRDAVNDALTLPAFQGVGL